MINFKQKSIDENKVYLEAKNSFFKSVNALYKDDREDYKSFYGDTKTSELKVALSRIAYTKNFEVEDLFYFDNSSEFHIYATLYVFVIDEDLDRELLGTYTIAYNENFEVVDDFLLSR